MTVQQDKVASLLSRAVQEVLGRGLNDPRIRGLVSVTKVSVSPDLADATIGVSVIPVEHASTTLHGLRHAARHLRTEVGHRTRLRRTPRLHFELDEGLKKQAEVLAAINKTHDVDEPAASGETSQEEQAP
jgi:ribosome-binding factor A